MSNTWISSRSDATRPVNRPTLVRPVPVCARSWTPPPATQRATTTSIEDQAKTPQASRHHKGTGSGRVRPARLAIRGGTPNLGAVDDTDIGSGAAVMIASIAQNLGRFMDGASEFGMRHHRLQGNGQDDTTPSAGRCTVGGHAALAACGRRCRDRVRQEDRGAMELLPAWARV